MNRVANFLAVYVAMASEAARAAPADVRSDLAHASPAGTDRTENIERFAADVDRTATRNGAHA